MPKQRSSDKTTAELLKEAARSLFAKYGYEGTPVRMIAKKAGVTAGQITANFGSKENLLNDIVMDFFDSACSIYDPIRAEYEFLKNTGNCTEENVWNLIERFIDAQITYAMDEKNQDSVKILNVHVINEKLHTSAKLAQLTKSKIENLLSDLLREVFAQKRSLHVITISRAVNGSIISFTEHPELLFSEVVSSHNMPDSKIWMREYIKNYIMDSLHAEAKRI